MKFYLLFIMLFIAVFCPLQTTHAQEQDCACCTETHQAFDFWLGEWEVFTADGKVAGYNSITKIQDQCALQENWTSANVGYSGTSYNYYNQTEERWEQLWVDNAGAQLKLYGNRVGNQMILASEPFKGGDGELFVNRITWTSNQDGSVRQLWEVLRAGEVVQVAFDGLYKKRIQGKE